MSFDRQIDQVCPHLVVEEALFVQNNNQVVRPLRPIASFASVAVRLNRTIECPSQGVFTQARVEGTRIGPYNIQTSSNTMVLQVADGADQTVVLPVAASMSPTQVTEYLNAGVTGVAFSVSPQNRIVMQSNGVGAHAKVFIKSGSTLATLLGIPQNRVYRGKDVVPGWTLVTDPTTDPVRPARLVVFDQPLKGLNDFVELNYTTVRQECRRCGGLGFEYDWRYGKDGDVAEVRDEALLLQELLKDTFTIRGSNPFYFWYGSSLLEQIGTKQGASALTQNAIITDIYETFRRWQSIKKQQEQAAGQFVSDREYPFRLLSVDLQQSTSDPTVVFVNVQVQNRAGDSIVLDRGLKLPSTPDLLGTTTAEGVFRQSLRDFTLVG